MLRPCATSQAMANGDIFIVDGPNARIRKVTASSGIITTVVGTGTAGYAGDGGLAVYATIGADARGMCLLTTGDFFLVDSTNKVLRLVNATTGIITTYAGTGASCSTFPADGSAILNMCFHAPADCVIMAGGDMLVADSGANAIYRLSATAKTVTLYAGSRTGASGFSGDGGYATSAGISTPAGMAISPADDLYFVDQSNLRIRKITASSGVITTYAGTGTSGFSGELIPDHNIANSFAMCSARLRLYASSQMQHEMQTRTRTQAHKHRRQNTMKTCFQQLCDA